jgi:AraC-like DNA-binding protein
MLEWIPVPGEILIMDVTGETVADDHLQNVIRSIRQDFPVAVGIRLESPDVGRAMRMAAWSCTAGARVVLGDDTQLNASLHESFAWPVDLSREIAEWFRMHLALSDAEAAWVHAVCRASQRARTVADAYRSMEDSERTVRARLSRAGLPSPERWFNLVRLVELQDRMLQHPDLSTARAALDIGYSCGQGLDNAIRRSFGVSAVRARRLLGIEWRLHAWSERTGVNARRHDRAASRVAVARALHHRQVAAHHPPESPQESSGPRQRIRPRSRDFARVPATSRRLSRGREPDR